MKLKDFAKAILALVFLAFFISLVWVLFTSMIKVFGDSTSTVEPTVVVAIISGLGAIIVNAISKNSDRKSQLLMKTKDKMVSVYEDFLNELSEAKTDDDKKTVMEKYQSVFAVNSSDETYSEFLALKKSNQTNTERIIIAIRKELKVSTKNNSKNK